MLISVDHVTTYRYDRPMARVVQSLRLTPSDCEGQRIQDWTIAVTGGTRGAAFRDGAGDRVEGWTVAGPVTEIAVSARGIVETTDMAGVLRGLRETVPPAAWLRDTPATGADATLCDLAQRAGAGRDPLDLAHRLAGVVSDAIAYRPGATHAHTTAAEALALGEGVCQDHAHAMIACARVRGLPARYVSGYLAANDDCSPHEAAHAWAEIWVDGLGWVGFDPANRCCPDARYIRLGCGRDAREAAPIRGIGRGQGEERLDVAVAVMQAQQ